MCGQVRLELEFQFQAFFAGHRLQGDQTELEHISQREVNGFKFNPP